MLLPLKKNFEQNFITYIVFGEELIETFEYLMLPVQYDFLFRFQIVSVHF